MSLIIAGTESLGRYSGNDTNFIIKLNQTFRARRLRLSGISCNNWFSNFGLGYTDFGFYTSSGYTPLTISQVNLNINQFQTYFNNAQSSVIISLSTYLGKITITSSGFSPAGAGWSLLGYQTLYPTRPLDGSQLADTYYNLNQSMYMYVALNEYKNAYEQEMKATFRVPLASTSTFGGILNIDQKFIDNDQQTVLASLESISQLNITLLDDNHQPLQTQNNNNTGLPFTIILVAYEDPIIIK